MMIRIALALSALLLTAPALTRAADAAARSATQTKPQTAISEPGKVIWADDFAQGLPPSWKAAKGKWEASDGALKAAELKAEMHGAAARRPLGAQDVIIRYSFKIDGAKTTTLSINDPTGHLCRLVINAAGYMINKDDHDHDGPDKAARLDAVKVPIKPGVWHTAVVEIVGDQMAARIDDLTVAKGSNEAIKAKKANLGLTVAGETVSFKDLTVWEATKK